jgi:transcriptional regulator with PAS, ATPase and Fis domain
LRVIQERKIKPVGDNLMKEIDVRVIAATHKDLKKSIQNGTFREDLYYRLSVIPIVVPPLRHRLEDIPILAQYFLNKYSILNSKPVSGFSFEAMQILVNNPWPGNVRELENLVERLVVLTPHTVIQGSEIPNSEDRAFEGFYGEAIQNDPTLEDLEKRYVRLILDKTGGRKEKAAQILGINRRTLYRKERDYGFVSDTDPEPESHGEE